MPGSYRLGRLRNHLSVTCAAVTGACDSCGDEVADLVAVRRVYLTPETWDTAGRSETLDEVERWCFPCRTHYPHEPASG